MSGAALPVHTQWIDDTTDEAAPRGGYGSAARSHDSGNPMARGTLPVRMDRVAIVTDAAAASRACYGPAASVLMEIESNLSDFAHVFGLQPVHLHRILAYAAIDATVARRVAFVAAAAMLDAALNPTVPAGFVARAVAGIEAVIAGNVPFDHPELARLNAIAGSDPSLTHAAGHASRKFPAWVAGWTGQQAAA